MQKRKFDELISYFNRKVSDMSIDQKYKMELLGMISAIGFAHENEHGTNLASLGTDCISRQAAIDEVKQLYEWHDTVTEDRLIDHLKRLPSAQPMRKKGEWVSPFGIGCVCNCCGYDINEHGIDIRVDGEPNFCPNCGADMRGEQDE